MSWPIPDSSWCRSATAPPSARLRRAVRIDFRPADSRRAPDRDIVVLGGATIIAGLLIFGVVLVGTIGSHGVGGDLLFATAGLFWATFGILLRYWHVRAPRDRRGRRAVRRRVRAALCAVRRLCGMLQMSGCNILQIVVQGILAGVLPIFLFARAVILIGAGRTATFPASCRVSR